MEWQNVRGTRDFLPHEAAMRDEVFGKIKPILEKYGFAPVVTPALESFELLAKKAGEQIKNEIYTFKDKGGRDIGLKFDGTVPVARIVASNPTLPKPIKFYYYDRYWRYDEPQAGRYREFWQVAVELLGAPNVIADAEIIACAVDCLKSVGLENIKIIINSKKVAEGFLSGLKAGSTAAVLRVLDKREKITDAEFKQELKKLGFGDRELKQINEFIQLKGPAKTVLENAKGKLNQNKLVAEGIDELSLLLSYLNKYKIADKCIIDFSTVRGLDYYTGTVFEIKEENYKLSILGGGRYDELVGIYGPEKVPATGWAMGFDRVIEILKKSNATPKAREESAFIIPVDSEAEELSIALLQEMRADGIKCEIDLLGRNVKKCLEHANKIGAKFIIIIGPEELKSNRVTVRNMKTREEKKVKYGEVKYLVRNWA